METSRGDQDRTDPLMERLSRRRPVWQTASWLLFMGVSFAVIWALWGQGRYETQAARLVSAGFALVLLGLSAIDLDRYILPDLLTWPLVVAGLVWTGYFGDMLIWSGLGAGLGYGVIAGLAWYWRSRKGQEGIGLGDAKLAAGLGAWLGAASLPHLFLVASALALIVAFGLRIRSADRNPQLFVPFGPFLCSAGWALWCAPISSGLG